MLDLQEVSSILDDTIEKGQRLEERSLIERYEDDITKSLSHDPYHPHVMNADSPYHNPYDHVQGVNGGFLPMPVEHFKEQGMFSPDKYPHNNYLTNKRFYETLMPKIEKVQKEFRGFARSLAVGDLEKAGVKILKADPIPDGARHTYNDGKDYVKKQGRWSPSKSKEDMGQRLEQDDLKAHQEIEQHATSTRSVQEHLGHKEREEKIVERAKKEAIQEFVAHMKKLGKKMDPEVQKEMEKIFSGMDKDSKDEKGDQSPEEHLHDLNDELNGKHRVHAHFSVGGNQYKHTFNDVSADDEGGATTKVTEALSNRFPQAKIHKVKVDGDKVEKSENSKVKKKILKFFKDNPNPSDKQVHSFAGDIGIDEHKLEEHIYSLLTEYVKVEKSGKEHERQEKMGKEVEKEHSGTIKKIIADAKSGKLKSLDEYLEDIAEDHIDEVRDYYTRLKKMEKEAKDGKSYAR